MCTANLTDSGASFNGLPAELQTRRKTPFVAHPFAIPPPGCDWAGERERMQVEQSISIICGEISTAQRERDRQKLPYRFGIIRTERAPFRARILLCLKRSARKLVCAMTQEADYVCSVRTTVHMCASRIEFVRAANNRTNSAEDSMINLDV